MRSLARISTIRCTSAIRFAIAAGLSLAALIVAAPLARAQCTSSFLPAVNYVAGNTPYSVAIGDFNADGRPDLAVANVSSNNVSILLGNGNGTFQGAVNYASGVNPRSVAAVGDFNGDGRPDSGRCKPHQQQRLGTPEQNDNSGGVSAALAGLHQPCWSGEFQRHRNRKYPPHLPLATRNHARHLRQPLQRPHNLGRLRRLRACLRQHHPLTHHCGRHGKRSDALFRTRYPISLHRNQRLRPPRRREPARHPHHLHRRRQPRWRHYRRRYCLLLHPLRRRVLNDDSLNLIRHTLATPQTQRWGVFLFLPLSHTHIPTQTSMQPPLREL